MSTLFGVPTAADSSPAPLIIRTPPPLNYGTIAAPAELPALSRRCAAGSASACTLLGRSLAASPAPDTDPRVPFPALHYMIRACALHHGAGCTGAGLIHANAGGTPRHVRRANYYFARGCRLDDGYACYALGIAYQQGHHLRRSPRRAARYYAKGCRLNDGRACNSLGASYRSGLGVGRDDVRASSLYDRACELGNRVGCQNLRLMQVLP